MTAESQIVMGRDGTVLGATEPAQAGWVGRRLEDCADAPADLKEAARALLRSPTHPSSAVSVRMALQSMPQGLALTVIDALPLRRQATDLRTLLRSSLEVLQRQASAFDIALTITVDQNVPSNVSLDAVKIAWAATTLVGNSLRYVRHGSQVMPGGSVSVNASYDPARREIALVVEDDGPGIAPEKLRDLFGSPKDPRRAGLGLSMIRDVVAAHGGSVDVRSDPKAYRGGTTVRLTLPAS